MLFKALILNILVSRLQVQNVVFLFVLQESVDLGEIMYSLCYLPTAGRMTLTVIKCRNLKAMDITGSSGNQTATKMWLTSKTEIKLSRKGTAGGLLKWKWGDVEAREQINGSIIFYLHQHIKRWRHVAF